MPTQPFITRLRAAFISIRQAIKGEPHDYTSGSIRKAVVLLAIPMMLEMCMESVFALVDIYFVGHLGKHATSTVGLTESVITIVYSIAIGISMAATALVARRVGEKKPEEAANAGVQAILMALLITVVISIPGFIFASDILRLMGAEPEAIAIGSIYTRILMGGSVFILLLFLINGIFRGAGDALMAMKSLWVANICNIILCPLLIRGLGPIPPLGLAGAAMATTIGRGIGVCYQVFHLFRGKGILKFSAAHIKPDWAVIRSVVNIGWPGTLQFLINSGSWIVLARLVVITGHSDASAGYQVAIRIVMFFLLPAWGMSNAAATLVGQNLGAKQPDRAEQSVLRTAKYNVIFMGVVSLLLLSFAQPLTGFFTTDPHVQVYAVQSVRIIGLGFFFYGMGMVMNNAFNGSGDTRTPTLLNFIGFWLFQVPVAYTLSTWLNWGPLGVFIAIPLAETGISISAYILFKKGRWKTV
ncbi:MAG: MATE family efflux transporter, partial [Bacteroidetes bacterium]|nr:MATE family efflux transporter [Bacteroidota bacterium]